MEDELPLPPLRKYSNKTERSGDNGEIPLPPLKKYTPFIDRCKEYWQELKLWWSWRPKFPPKYQDSE